MTKKPIMIDDVDVAGCEYWNGSELGYCNIGLWANDGTHICECEPNCHYKQLKRKEQECDQLQKELDIISCANIELSLEVKKYEKAIEEIEEIADNNNENPEMERIFNIIGGLNV